MRAAPTRLIGLAALAAALLPAAPAAASQITSNGSTVTYTAAPGESNSVLVSRVEYDTSCGSIGAPCLSVFDSQARITSVSGACELVSSSPIYGDTAVCSVPTDVVANLGDRDDAYWGWSGPNIVDGGAGNDTPITGAGGDDSLHGGIGSDELEGWDGDDLLDGGPGDDYLEGIAYVEEGMTHGTDTYIGGGGYDTVTYEGRTEDLSLSPDGVANDGATGEHDDIGTDIMAIGGGHGADTMTGNGARNVFGGGEGDDVLDGAGGDDHLVGASGADKLTGGPGQDLLGGESGDDLLIGGPGVDRFYGDSVSACIAYSCPSGRDDIRAQDGEQEEINCGPGTDTTELDPFDIAYNSVTLVDQCEGVLGQPTTPGGASGAAALKVSAAKADRRGRIVVKLTVPGPGTISARARASRLAVGSAKRQVSKAGATTLTLKPTRAAKRALRARKRLAVTVKVTFKPAGGGSASTQSRRVILKR
ncbi:MAG TPA: calcium-binding protein [Solirubrobacteraceae bacterium]|nr:calcium-binding protein [Solirubrobacteraceae bacterium]